MNVVFCRVHTKYAVARTFLELIAPAPIEDGMDPDNVFPLVAIADRQGNRPVKWHATEVGLPEEKMLDLAQHIERQGVVVGFVPADRRERFFLGGNPGMNDYDGTADAGLFIEVGRSDHLGLPEDSRTAPDDVPDDAGEETMVRIVAREYLVDDLRETLAVLKEQLRWSPTSVTQGDGCIRAIMSFRAPRSARLELVQAAGPGRVADAYEKVGAGAWTIRIAVVDVNAKADDLKSRNTPFECEGGVLRPDPASTLEVPFEFIGVRKD